MSEIAGVASTSNMTEATVMPVRTETSSVCTETMATPGPSGCPREDATPRRRGPVTLTYIENSKRRREAQCRRKKGLLKAALEFNVLTGRDVLVVLNEPKCGRTVYGTGELMEQYKAGTLRSLTSDNTQTSDSIVATNKITVPPPPNTPPKSFANGAEVPHNIRSFLYTDGVSPVKVAKNKGNNRDQGGDSDQL
ncbi:hypothetical protein Bbelb_406870 [Branchiostoma belcheri]|nr:hypothetical protein Bbelb_406870 [Branchiostoma belcheri]